MPLNYGYRAKILGWGKFDPHIASPEAKMATRVTRAIFSPRLLVLCRKKAVDSIYISSYTATRLARNSVKVCSQHIN